jgi:SAM-dependent methyltransferase
MLLSWYRERLREHGFRTATPLLVAVVSTRCATMLANRLLPSRVVCPCCGWRGRRFFDFRDVDFNVPAMECPRCNSHPRHRLFFLWLRDEYRLRDRRGRALVFAPERGLDAAWSEARGLSILRTDIEPARGVDLLADIQRLPFAADSFDLVWCHHVLTQIPDDRAAIAELFRVLRPRAGELVISVQQERGARTREFGRADGRHLGFWRTYGDDFAGRLEEGGFDVRPVGYRPAPEEASLYGIDPEEGFFICTKPGGS